MKKSLLGNLNIIFRTHPDVVVETLLNIFYVLAHFIIEVTRQDWGYYSMFTNEEIEL